MSQTLALTLPFFALIGAGYGAGRGGLVAGDGVRGLNLFVFYFALPALLFRATWAKPLGEMVAPDFALAYTAAGLTAFALTALAGRVLFRLPLAACAVQGQAASVGNVGFLALPLLLAVLGEAAAAPVLLGWMIDLIVLVPLSIVVLEIARHKGSGISWPAFAAKVARGVVLNPFVASIAVGILYHAAGLPRFAVLDTFTDLLARAAGPAALFTLGATLAGRPMAESLAEAGFLSAAKLLVHPALMAGAMALWFDGDPLWATAAILVASAPVAGNVYVVAAGYGVYAVRASTAIVVSTGLAVVTFSLMVGYLAGGG